MGAVRVRERRGLGKLRSIEAVERHALHPFRLALNDNWRGCASFFCMARQDSAVNPAALPLIMLLD